MLKDIYEFLGCPTPKAWIERACIEQEILLLDHKNCEYKAASTALSLMAKYHTNLELITIMSRIAREELVHYEQVLRILKQREIKLRFLSAGDYASQLMSAIRAHEPCKLVDTLIVGALIEARSCERFSRLYPFLDEQLSTFYFGLLKSESRHFMHYIHFAYEYGTTQDVKQSIERLVSFEKTLIEGPSEVFRFHSGVPI